MQQHSRHFLSHTGIYLIARGLPGIVAFVAIPLFSRLLEPADYGRYALVVATVGLLNALLFQWLRLSLMRYMPAYKGDPHRLKSTLLSVALLMIAALGVLAAGICLLPIGSEWRSLILPCWVVLAVQAMFELFSEYSRAVIQPWRNMVFQLMRVGAFVLVGAAFVWGGWTWWGPLAGATVGMLLAIVYGFRQDWRGVRLSIDPVMLKRLAVYGVPLSLTVALAVVISVSDRFLISWYLGESAAGLYAVANDFTEQSLTMLMMVVNLAMYPLAVRAWEEQGRDAAQDQMRSNASLLMAVGLPAVVGIGVLTPGIATCFFGERFRESAVGVMPLIAIAAFLGGLKAYHFDAAFQFAHRTIYQVWIVLFVAIVNIVLNVIAIPTWGIKGAAGATLLAYVVSIGLTAYFGRRHFALPFPLKACAQVVLACGVMAMVLWPFRDAITPAMVATQIAVGIGVYGVVLIGSNFLGLRDAIAQKYLGVEVDLKSSGHCDGDVAVHLVETRQA
ncbi:MAG TPA: oligosaccharide flippase family protein [Tepidisphaeraceae bacterium]|jgi:O-antigen/teichoic acid export membrane protein|nr:oligosaccharide flippase family protein [Tepidisphaeraceae bacterium]